MSTILESFIWGAPDFLESGSRTDSQTAARQRASSVVGTDNDPPPIASLNVGMQWLSEEMFNRRANRNDDDNFEMTDRDDGIGMTTTANEDDDDDEDNNNHNNDYEDINFESASLAGMDSQHHSRHQGTTMSVVGSIAHTLTSTAYDGIVHTVAHWRVLLLGQFVALVLAMAGGTNDVLAIECDISAPGTYNAFGYAIVGVFGAMLVRVDMRREGRGGDRTGDGGVRDGGEVENDGGGEASDYDEDMDDDDDDDLTLEDDGSTTKRMRIFSIGRRKNDVDRDVDRRRIRRREALEAQMRHRRMSNESRGRELRSSRPTYPFLFGLFRIRAKWYYYLAVAIIEAQAFYFVFLAFRYTTFTFAYVSDALAIPSAMFFSRLIMKRRYSVTHLLGCGICISGIIVNTASDLRGGGDDGRDGDERHTLDHIKGDIFAIIGAILLGLDDVLSEIIVNDFGGVNEMLFMKGLYGSLISIIQLGMFERDNARALFGKNGGSCDFDWKMILFSGHLASRAMGVMGEMQFLAMSEA